MNVFDHEGDLITLLYNYVIDNLLVPDIISDCNWNCVKVQFIAIPIIYHDLVMANILTNPIDFKSMIVESKKIKLVWTVYLKVWIEILVKFRGGQCQWFKISIEDFFGGEYNFSLGFRIYDEGRKVNWDCLSR